MTFSIVDHIPPELFPEFTQTIALDRRVAVTVGPEPVHWWELVTDDAWLWGVSVWAEDYN